MWFQGAIVGIQNVSNGVSWHEQGLPVQEKAQLMYKTSLCKGPLFIAITYSLRMSHESRSTLKLCTSSVQGNVIDSKMEFHSVGGAKNLTNVSCQGFSPSRLLQTPNIYNYAYWLYNIPCWHPTLQGLGFISSLSILKLAMEEGREPP